MRDSQALRAEKIAARKRLRMSNENISFIMFIFPSSACLYLHKSELVFRLVCVCVSVCVYLKHTHTSSVLELISRLSCDAER